MKKGRQYSRGERSQIEHEVESNHYAQAKLNCRQEQLTLKQMKYKVRYERNETHKNRMLQKIKNFPNKHCSLLEDLNKILGYN